MTVQLMPKVYFMCSLCSSFFLQTRGICKVYVCVCVCVCVCALLVVYLMVLSVAYTMYLKKKTLEINGNLLFSVFCNFILFLGYNIL